MVIHNEKQEGVVIVAPRGRIDSTTSEAVEQALVVALESGDRRIVFDFGSVDYISSAGLRVLLVTAKKIGGGRLVLCGMAEPVRQVFDLAGFLPLFTVESSRDHAIARMVSAK